MNTLYISPTMPETASVWTGWREKRRDDKADTPCKLNNYTDNKY